MTRTRTHVGRSAPERESTPLATEHARRVYQRFLAAWASDVLRWQASDRELAARPAGSAGDRAWRRAA